MTCGNCARHVTEAIQSVSGVRSATVSLADNNAAVRWDPGAPEDAAAVIDAVKRAGYEAREIQEEAIGPNCARTERKSKNWRLNLWLGVTVTAALMMGEWVAHLAMAAWFQWLSFALAGAVQIFAGAQFYRGAWNRLKIGSSNMDTLVALGSTTAFGYSAWALVGGTRGELYFMEAAAIITLISLGHWLEARVSDKAGGALKFLMQLAPQTARRVQSPESNVQGLSSQPLNLKTVSFSKPDTGHRESDIETEVPVSELKIGDRIIIKPGDRVPVDGVVVEGDSAIDESMLTGESIPADKKTGSDLFTGTMNLNGRLVMRVTATGESTELAHVIAAVQRAQSSGADIQRLGDRVSSVFVPIVVVIAIATGFWWGLAPESANRLHDSLAHFFWHSRAPIGIAAGFIIAAAVLIVACPCAMGLATPAAIMAGANAAARRGILIRDGVALEKAGKITAIIFDKTGTLTLGRPEVAETWQSTTGATPVLRLAATLARHSTHPISQAVAASRKSTANPDGGALTNAATLEDWKEIRGCGVEAKAKMEDGRWKMARLGSLRWLKESGVDLVAGEKFIADWSNQGATIVGLAGEKNLLALFAVRDAVKSNAANVVEQLRQKGLKIYLVTGDNSQTAASIAKQVGIAAENVFAEVRPEQKAEFVKKLQAGGCDAPSQAPA